MKSIGLLLSLVVVVPAYAEEGTADHPLALTCENLKEMIAGNRDRTDGPVIAGTMTIEAEDDTRTPPIALGCKGDTHVVCVMELPSSVAIGTEVKIQGRMSKIGQNYAGIDPCGVVKE